VVAAITTPILLTRTLLLLDTERRRWVLVVCWLLLTARDAHLLSNLHDESGSLCSQCGGFVDYRPVCTAFVLSLTVHPLTEAYRKQGGVLPTMSCADLAPLAVPALISAGILREAVTKPRAVKQRLTTAHHSAQCLATWQSIWLLFSGPYNRRKGGSTKEATTNDGPRQTLGFGHLRMETSSQYG
jgi:hypothetical protein